MSITPPATAPGISQALEAQLRECFGRVAYSHKTHEKAADLLQKRLRRLKTWQVVLSGLTTSGLITTLFAETSLAYLATAGAAIVSAILLVLTTYTKDFDLGSKSQAHKDTADRLWDIRETYLSLLTDATAGTLTESGARTRREELQERLASIYEGAPRTDGTAYGAAQEALKVKEDLTFSDSEIDMLLPAAMRKGTGK